MTGWNDREPDEPLLDWLLRIRISAAAVAGLIRIPVPAGQNILTLPRGCGEFHAGECTSELPYTGRTAS